MATQIPKLITNVEPYFRYEGEANATTQDQFQGFLKNEHSVLAVLVKGIWQPTTAYEIGDIIKSPNMPKGFHAIAQTKGNSGANEPTWGDGTTNVSDGTVSWKLSKGDITVNGVGADSNGNIQINNITNATHANNADLATKATNADNATKATKDNKNQTIDTTYIKDITIENGVLTITKGNGVQNTDTDSITVTGSNLPERTFKGTSTGGIDSTSGSGNVVDYESKTVRAIKAGTYSLQSLLQNLVNNSHKHATYRKNTNCVCDCNCDCSTDSDSNCIICGYILTDRGYIDIRKLGINDNIVGIDGNKYKVMGIKLARLGKRKAVSFTYDEGAVFTDDHLYLINDNYYGAFNIEGYIKESSHIHTDGNVYGTYDRSKKKPVCDLSKYNDIFDIKMKIRDEFTESSIAYMPIVENCEWCIVNDIPVACLRYVK